jgi:hypothetical protein
MAKPYTKNIRKTINVSPTRWCPQSCLLIYQKIIFDISAINQLSDSELGIAVYLWVELGLLMSLVVTKINWDI